MALLLVLFVDGLRVRFPSPGPRFMVVFTAGLVDVDVGVVVVVQVEQMWWKGCWYGKKSEDGWSGRFASRRQQMKHVSKLDLSSLSLLWLLLGCLDRRLAWWMMREKGRELQGETQVSG